MHCQAFLFRQSFSLWSRLFVRSRVTFSSCVSLTSDAHPHLKRSSSFGRLSDSDHGHFESILPPECLIKDPDILATHNEDWTKRYRGQSTLLLRPKSVDQLSAILSYCHTKRQALACIVISFSRLALFCSLVFMLSCFRAFVLSRFFPIALLYRLAVVPQGGNTGLVGGSVPVFDEIILSLALLNQDFYFDAQSGVVSCSAGWTLQALDEKLKSEHGYTVPLDLGAKGR